MSSTSHYEVFGTLPTLTDEEKERIMNPPEPPEPYVLPAASADALGGVKLAENVADSEAETLAALVTSFNALLASLKAAGIMAADEEAEEAET